jgi:hypothetical protein
VELRKEGAKTKSAAGSEVESAQTWVLSAASRIGAFGCPGSGFTSLPQALLLLVSWCWRFSLFLLNFFPFDDIGSAVFPPL